ncbi:sigma-54-dependent transcriptional regulator [Polluticaenibacter yanchengensis]|uniref:Sigma-54 dependent transcriptional regulator n=1 Tax=Polluticaenibacter yanchengensis TaxID=3014562 RepID=A0ABT4UPG2_9BACT|nr:sigma-54 dependent transcriptional regulator [Chitinophagaceae bacterium LY-5]
MLLKNASILVVDDDKDVLTAVHLLLKTEAKKVVTESNPENIRQLLHTQEFHLVLLDMNFKSPVHTGNEGFFWLNEIKRLKPAVEVIMITAYGSIDLAVRSLKEGASDFLLKPWYNDKLVEHIKEALGAKKQKNSTKLPADAIIGNELLGESDEMQKLFIKIKKIAPTDANVLILGENGTGKDLIARTVHQQSLRAGKPFIKVDVGALTESLFESELFGYKKGAFTDAKEDREGRFEAANGGTLFLDEIGNISLHLQSKLLSVLQNRQVMRLGSNEAVPVDIRLVCATNIPVSELANEAKFRKDFVYRIHTVDLMVPPLRKRDEDILMLAAHFCNLYGRKYFKSEITLSQAAIAKLKTYHFPGNVRELQYSIERAVIMAETDTVSAEDLIFLPLETTGNREESKDTKLSSVEKATILRVIDKNNGNISKAAKELGITRTALYRRINKYDIE